MGNSWQLFDRIRAFMRQGNIYRAENIHQDQTSVDRLGQAGLNLASPDGLIEQTNLQINRLERFKDYDQMSEMGEIALALDLYADEATLTDLETKHVLNIRSKYGRVRSELSDLFFSALSIDSVLRSWVRYLCKYGDLPLEIVPTKDRDGVATIRPMNVYNFSRVETRKGDLVGFFYHEEGLSEPTFLHPWQVAHIKLDSLENIFRPYGLSILQNSRKDFKRLRLMEDAALIYRITRAPIRRVFKIPVGNLPPHQVEYFMDVFARKLKKRRIYNPNTGEIDERWSPLIQEDDYYLPRRPDGTGPEVDTLPGAENLDQIADIEYFKKKMIAALKIPFSRVGIGESGEDSRQSLSQAAPEFAKAVQWIQRQIAIGLKKIALVHLALKRFSLTELKSIDLYLPASSAIDTLYRIEKWSTAADVMATLKDIGYFSRDWILRTFTDLSSDEIEKMQKEISAEEGGSLPAMGEVKLEGFDYTLERQVLQEYAGMSQRSQLIEPVQSSYTPPVEYYVNNNELDGEGLLEQEIDSNRVTHARQEVKKQYLAEHKQLRDAIKAEEQRREKLFRKMLSEDTDITKDDLPM